MPGVRWKNGWPRLGVQVPGPMPDGLASGLGAGPVRRVRRATEKGDPDQLRRQIAITWLNYLAHPGSADFCLSRRCSRGACRSRPAFEPDQYFCTRIDPSQIDLRTVSFCALGHRRYISDCFWVATLLDRKVQEEKERRWARASPGVRQQSGGTSLDGHPSLDCRRTVHGNGASDRHYTEGRAARQCDRGCCHWPPVLVGVSISSARSRDCERTTRAS